MTWAAARQLGCVRAALLAALLAIPRPARCENAFAFTDVGVEAGLVPHLEGIKGHGAGWGDIDADGWIDLYVATFRTEGSKPNTLLRNLGGKFQLDPQEAPRISCRATGVVLADLDNDGDLDLYVASMPRAEERGGPALAPCALFRNEGGGELTDISRGSGACPPAFGGRSATVLDLDGDGLLDLLVGEDPVRGYSGSATRSSRLFRNRGRLAFEDVSREAGLPEGIPGLGVAAADVNDDGWPDVFIAANDGGNVLFLNDARGKLREAPGSRVTFAWKGSGGDDMVCGVCFGDVDRDGLLDIAIGQHYEAPWRKPVPVRLYVNRGVKDGTPIFEDVTARAGLDPLPMKAPHVEIQDFDNDGWPDLYASVVKFAGGKAHPVIFRNLGPAGGSPRFRQDALGVNDFPTAEDAAIPGARELFAKVLAEKKVFYSASGPSGDFNNDGRLDIFLPSWWMEAPSLLLRNETRGGRWLQVELRCDEGVNSMGIGSRVKVFPAGKLGEASSLLGSRDLGAGYGYASGQPAVAHFGLGGVEEVDLEISLPHGKGTIVRRGIRADRRLRVPVNAAAAAR